MSNDNRIRVLHYIPGFRYGGIETIFLSHCRNIDRDRFKFDLLTETTDELPIFDKLRKLDCDVYRVKSPIKEPFVYFQNINKFFRGNKGKFDVLHSRCLGGRSASILYYARKYGIKYRIVHTHSVVGCDHRIREFVENTFLVPISLKLATDRCACSELAGKTNFHSKPFHWVKNGIDLTLFESISKENVQAVRNELGIKEGEKVIGNVCRFTYAKNLLRLVDIFAKIHEKDRSIRLLLIGDGPDFSAVKQKISDYGLENVAILTGFRSDVPVLFHAMDMLFLPSRYESFGNVITEAIASNLRCLTSDTVGYPRYNDRVFFLSLKESADETWANMALEILQKPRFSDGSDFLKKVGLDIKDSADDLCDFYIKAMNDDPSRY